MSVKEQKDKEEEQWSPAKLVLVLFLTQLF